MKEIQKYVTNTEVKKKMESLCDTLQWPQPSNYIKQKSETSDEKCRLFLIES